MESDDLLALGELADLARRVRGGDGRVYFVQNLYLNQTNVCRVKCKFCAFAKTRKQEDAYTITPTSSSTTRSREHELTGFTEIHMVERREPARRLRLLRRHHRAAPRGASRTCA